MLSVKKKINGTGKLFTCYLRSFKPEHELPFLSSYFWIEITRGDNLEQISRSTQYVWHESLFSMYHYYHRRCSRSCREDVMDAAGVKSNF